MIMLLTRKPTLTCPDAIDFYYRRIKRIVPTYVFVICLILVSAYFLISEFEYNQVANEAIPSLFFYSNFPSVHRTAYFDAVSPSPNFSTKNPRSEIKIPTLPPHLVPLY
jgi:peptidoglycan/LPS O-acetylase OafA/YrhL